MKKKLSTIVFFIFISISYSQTVTFEYDAAGNQIKRTYISNGNRMAQSESKKYTELTQNDFLKFFPEDVISYYPNPVKEELFLKWELQDNKKVVSIDIFSITGQFMNKSSISNTTSAIVSFSQFSSGTYLVSLNYDTGEQKTITIIKQ